MGIKASIVIPNWNGKHFLKTCLDSLSIQTFKDFEIVIVDNGSTDGSVGFLKENYPDVRVVRFPENRGFSVAVNEGIKASKGEYIALLNNDTEVDSKWLEELVNALDRYPEAGFCASKMLNYYRRNIVDTAGDGFSRYGLAFKRGGRKEDGQEYSREENLFGACAGAAIYRKKLFDEIGLFDEDFFAYLEDADLSFRAQLKGFRCLYVPTAVVYHMMGGTSGGKGYSFKRMAGKVVNKLFVLIKNMPARLFFKNLPFIIFAFIIEGFILFLSVFFSPGTFKKEVLRLRLIPRMLRKRREIQRGASGYSVEYIDTLLGKSYPLNPFTKDR
jgi:hypothetical protein